MRRLLRATVCSAAAFALLCGAARADEAQERANGEALLESLGEFLPRLAKARTLGFYNGRKKIGVLKWVVSKAPEGSEEGVVYQSTSDMQSEYRGLKILTDEWLDLDAKLGLIRRSQTEGNGQFVRTTDTKVVHGTWVTRVRKNEAQPVSMRVEAGPRNHWDATILLALATDLEPRTYRLSGVQWPKQPADDAAGKYVDIVITVPPAEPYTHRGKVVQAHLVRIVRGTNPATIAVIDADHQLLELYGTSKAAQPFRMVAGTDPELPLTDAEREILSTVKTYYAVLAKTVEVDALDGVIDWEALLRTGFAEGTTPDTVKQRLAEAPAAFDEKALAHIEALLTVRVLGKAATARLQGAPDESDFEFAEREAGWRITRVPGLGRR